MTRIPAILIAAIAAMASPAHAQQTTVYAYDVHGRLTTAGADSVSTASYLYDGATNRSRKRCCLPIGGWQVKDDGFDPYFYLLAYPDVRASGMDPYEHWKTNGHLEDRWPNLYFNTAWYRATYGIAPGVNPLTNYHEFGWEAGRNPSPEFSTSGYHINYPSTASIDPLQHYLRWGYGEGRQSFPV